MILVGISGCGTFIATNLLVFDGWVDALAVYMASGLMLTLLLSRLVGKQGGPHDTDPVIEPGRFRVFRAGSTFSRSPLIGLEPIGCTSPPDVTVAPVALGKATPTD